MAWHDPSALSRCLRKKIKKIKMSGQEDFFQKTFGCFAKKTYLCTAFSETRPDVGIAQLVRVSP